MDETATQRIELSIDTLAALLYAAGTAAVLLLLDASGGYVAVAAAIAFGGCLYGLRSIEPEYEAFRIAGFEPSEPEFEELGELLLTDEDRLAEQLPEDDDALLLDDVLAEISPDSRVVRLFDRHAMPTPGQLKARIDRHIGERDSTAPDASQALHDALAELRRSLG